jgi:Domain of unknown function (DUF1844)
MAENKNEEIRVEDRRHFDQEGNPIVQEEQKEPPQTHEQQKAERTEANQTSGTPPGLDFVAILFTYVHTALIYLGEVKDPEGKESENLEGARQMIDILEVMQQKTKGNLTKQEEQYLESALYDLRMRYMKKAKLLK